MFVVPLSSDTDVSVVVVVGRFLLLSFDERVLVMFVAEHVEVLLRYGNQLTDTFVRRVTTPLHL